MWTEVLPIHMWQIIDNDQSMKQLARNPIFIAIIADCGVALLA
jgi:hypothetical protein